MGAKKVVRYQYIPRVGRAVLATIICEVMVQPEVALRAGSSGICKERELLLQLNVPTQQKEKRHRQLETQKYHQPRDGACTEHNVYVVLQMQDLVSILP